MDRTRLWTWATVVLTGGCTGAGARDAHWAGSFDTLATGVVVVHNPARGSWTDERAWRIEEDLRIGSVDSDGPDQFGYVADVWADARGRIWVVDGPSAEIRVFGTDGTFVRTVGRKGAGPGELGAPIALEEGPGGRVWVADSGNGRWAVFDTAGTFVTSHPYAPGMFRFGDRWGSDGMLHTFVPIPGVLGAFRIVRRRDGPEGLVPVDTLPAPFVDPGEIVPLGFVRDGRRMSLMVPVPLQATAVRLLTAGTGWWLSHPGPRYRIARLDARTDTVRVVERPWDPVPVTAEDLARATADLPAGTELPREKIPGSHPPVQALAQLPDGHLLVRTRADAGDVFDVFDPRGAWLGSLPVPGGTAFTLHTATDGALYGVMRDELDVPRVVRLRIRR